MVNRHAFTMIELIFALVIMGVVFITLPLILLRNANSLEDNLIQESIFLTSTKLNQLLTFQWDNSSSAAGMSVVSTSDVINVTSATPGLGRVGNSDFRVGHFRESNRRRMTPVSAQRAAGANGLEGAIFDDVDDFNGLTNVELISGATSQAGYKKAYRADVNVSYVNDNNFLNGTSYNSNAIDFVFGTAGVAGTSNLKMVEVSIDQNNSTGWTTVLLLRAYVANIGETDFYSRTY